MMSALAKRSSLRGSKKTPWGLIFIAPGIVYFLVFWIMPVVMTVYQSLWRWRAGRRDSFLGSKNYTDLLEDPLFTGSVRATIIITVGSLVLGFLVAFGLALILNDDTLRGRRWFRLIIFMPVVTDWVATGLVWQLIYLPNQGVLASLFYSLGFRDGMTLQWTTDRTLAPGAIVLFVVWKTTGLYMMFLLAGLKSVPQSLVEAALVDGANSWQALRHVIIPLLKPIIAFVIILGFISGMGLFEPVYMLTGGGPASSTKTLPLFLHEMFFTFRAGGYASAASVAFLLICLAFAILAAWQLKQTAYEE